VTSERAVTTHDLAITLNDKQFDDGSSRVESRRVEAEAKFEKAIVTSLLLLRLLTTFLLRPPRAKMEELACLK
jgi:hypothetical protein